MIEEKMLQIIRAILGNDEIVMTDETTAEDVDGWDSLTHVRIILEIEKQFKIRFSSIQTSRLENWGDLKMLVQNQIGIS